MVVLDWVCLYWYFCSVFSNKNNGFIFWKGLFSDCVLVFGKVVRCLSIRIHLVFQCGSVWDSNFECHDVLVSTCWCDRVIPRCKKCPKAELFLMMMGTKVGKNGSIAGGRTWWPDNCLSHNLAIICPLSPLFPHQQSPLRRPGDQIPVWSKYHPPPHFHLTITLLPPHHHLTNTTSSPY